MTPPGQGLYGPQGHGWQDLQRNIIYCYKQNMKAPGLVVSEKKIFFYVLFFIFLLCFFYVFMFPGRGLC